MKWKYFKEKSVLKKIRVLIKIIRIILPWFIVQKVECFLRVKNPFKLPVAHT